MQTVCTVLIVKYIYNVVHYTSSMCVRIQSTVFVLDPHNLSEETECRLFNHYRVQHVQLY